ncbi:MAG: hypothetical protein RL748_3698 [Pseudomonadota bacterium]|jgi:general secretion pathway protein K
MKSRPPSGSKLHQFKRQQGVAIITAVLLTALALTIVGNLFWQQNVQLRMVENQQLKQKTRWILIGALDFARLLLNEDLKRTQTDDLTEPWATPLAETRLDSYLERNEDATDAGNASFSGKISDASALYNLENLATNRIINKYEVAVLKKLLINVRLNPSFADAVALAVASSQKPPVVVPNNPNNPPPPPTPGQVTGAPPPGGGTEGPPVPETPGKEPSPVSRLEDLLAVTGFTPAMVETLKKYVTVLPRQNGALSTVNINTTSAEVLSARIDTLSLSQAKSIILARERTPYRNIAFFWTNNNITADPKYLVDIRSDFFIATSTAKVDHATLESTALIHRTQAGTRILWIREI